MVWVFMLLISAGILITLILLFEPSILKPVRNAAPTRELYVSLTSIPERLQTDYFRQVIDTLLKQKPTKIVLNLPYTYARTGEGYTIPTWVTESPDIRVVRSEDYGPLTKILGGIDTVPDEALVVIVDDDQIYKDSVLQDLRSAYEKDPKGVWCFNVFAEDKWVKRGAHFRFAKDMPCGYGGFIAAAADLKRLWILPRFPTCFNIDDHWLGWAFHELRMPVRPLARGNGYFYGLKQEPNRKGSHPEWYELRSHTNRVADQRRCGDSIESYLKQSS